MTWTGTIDIGALINVALICAALLGQFVLMRARIDAIESKLSNLGLDKLPGLLNRIEAVENNHHSNLSDLRRQSEKLAELAEASAVQQQRFVSMEAVLQDLRIHVAKMSDDVARLVPQREHEMITKLRALLDSKATSL